MRKTQQPEREGAEVLHLSMPAQVAKAVRRDAAARYATLSEWFRDIAIPVLQRRGALPKK